MHSSTEGSDEFTGTPAYLHSNLYEKSQTLSDASVYVLNWLVRSISSGSHGGGLSCTSVQFLLVESTSFFSCRTSNYYGGAIYYVNTNNGQCVLREVCAYDCCSTYTGGSSHGQFSYIYVYNVASSKNYVIYSSIARCVNENSNSRYTMRHLYGNFFWPSVNVSMNKCGDRSGAFCVPFADSNSYIYSLTYSTFADNIAMGYTCIGLWTTGAKYEMKYCNILRNTQSSTSEGIIYTYDRLIIKDSCLLGNTGPNIYRVKSSSFTITLSNCTFDSTSNNGCLTIQNTITKSFILALNHISTQNCHSDYDSAGYLTPIIQTPSPSIKQIHCRTYGNFFQLPRTREVALLFSLLIFNFIYPYAFSGPW
jgi:hypothetical protein